MGRARSLPCCRINPDWQGNLSDCRRFPYRARHRSEPVTLFALRRHSAYTVCFFFRSAINPVCGANYGAKNSIFPAVTSIDFVKLSFSAPSRSRDPLRSTPSTCPGRALRWGGSCPAELRNQNMSRLGLTRSSGLIASYLCNNNCHGVIRRSFSERVRSRTFPDFPLIGTRRPETPFFLPAPSDRE